MNCPRCGKELDPNATFCGNCNTPLVNNNPQPMYTTPNPTVSNTNLEPQPINNEVNNMPMNQLPNNVNPAPKKLNPLFIAIPIVLVVIAVLGYFVFFKNSENQKLDNKPNTSDNVSKEENKPNENQEESNTSIKWDDYSLMIDGNEIHLPMKFKDFLAMGFYEMDTSKGSVLKREIKLGYNHTSRTEYGMFYGLFTNGKTNNIELVFQNNSNENKTVEECDIIGISFYNNDNYAEKFTMGEIKVINNTKKVEAVVGKTKREEIEDKFGLHAQYEYNTLTYYPDFDADGKLSANDARESAWYKLWMWFDVDTQVFVPKNLSFNNKGNLPNIGPGMYVEVTDQKE